MDASICPIRLPSGPASRQCEHQCSLPSGTQPPLSGDCQCSCQLVVQLSSTTDQPHLPVDGQHSPMAGGSHLLRTSINISVPAVPTQLSTTHQDTLDSSQHPVDPGTSVSAFQASSSSSGGQTNDAQLLYGEDWLLPGCPFPLSSLKEEMVPSASSSVFLAPRKNFEEVLPPL